MANTPQATPPLTRSRTNKMDKDTQEVKDENAEDGAQYQLEPALLIEELENENARLKKEIDALQKKGDSLNIMMRKVEHTHEDLKATLKQATTRISELEN